MYIFYIKIPSFFFFIVFCKRKKRDKKLCFVDKYILLIAVLYKMIQAT